MAEIIALVASITALCAVVLAPLVSIWTTDRQSRVVIRSGNRQAWINTLRDSISEFVSITAVLSMTSDKEMIRKNAERMFALEVKIKLLINSGEPDHAQLVDAIYALRQAAANTVKDRSAESEARLAEATGKVVPIAQPILKREWERVKRAE